MLRRFSEFDDYGEESRIAQCSTHDSRKSNESRIAQCSAHDSRKSNEIRIAQGSAHDGRKSNSRIAQCSTRDGRKSIDKLGTNNWKQKRTHYQSNPMMQVDPRWPRDQHMHIECTTCVENTSLQLGKDDYAVVLEEVYDGFMNEGASKNERFEEFMTNRAGNKAYGDTARSYDNLISLEDLEDQQRRYLPATNKSRDVKDLVPVVHMTAGATAQIVSSCILRTLFDTASGKSLISSRCLPRGTQIEPLKKNEVMKTMAGSFQPRSTVVLTDLRFSEFDKNW